MIQLGYLSSRYKDTLLLFKRGMGKYGVTEM
jgi:hypothetical protein